MLSGEDDDVIENAKQALHSQLAGGRRFDSQVSEFEEDSASLQDEKDVELETELEGKFSLQSVGSSPGLDICVFEQDALGHEAIYEQPVPGRT